MREIKFRAWNWENMIIPISIFMNTINHCEDYKLMQYTWLKDKNWKEIYEGDILKLENEYSYCDWSACDWECWTNWKCKKLEKKWEIWHIVYNDYRLRYIFSNNKWFKEICYIYGVVIWNIYENPELLK